MGSVLLCGFTSHGLLLQEANVLNTINRVGDIRNISEIIQKIKYTNFCSHALNQVSHVV